MPVSRTDRSNAVQPAAASSNEALKKFEGTWHWVDRDPTDATNLAPLKIKMVAGGLDVTQMNTDGSAGTTYKLRGTPVKSGDTLTLKSSGKEEARRGEKRTGEYEISIKGDEMGFKFKRIHEFGWISRSRSESSFDAKYTR